MPLRRFKLPVLSRLSWAWIGFLALSAGALLYASSDGGRTKAAVAMAIEGVERLAPPIDHAPLDHLAIDETRGDRLAAGATAQGAINAAETIEEPYGADTEDAMAAISDVALLREDPASDIVITVDGAPARAIGAMQVAYVAPPRIAAPDDALTRRSAYGPIPRIGSDGRKPSTVYAQPFTPRDAKSVALIVGGLGLNRALTERAIDELPPQVTLAFAPYAKDLAFWTKRARDAGHEILLEVPMENRAGDAEALGPAALLTSRSAAENQQRLEWLLSRFQGYFGVTNYLGARYVGDREAMEALLRQINDAGLAYFDDTGAVSRLSAKGEITTVDRVIEPGYKGDNSQTTRDLQSLEKVAERDGHALGKTYVHDETLGLIAEWAGSLAARDMTLAPASAVLAMGRNER